LNVLFLVIPLVFSTCYMFQPISVLQVQSIVCDKPSSNVTLGFHPSSLLILVASIAYLLSSGFKLICHLCLVWFNQNRAASIHKLQTSSTSLYSKLSQLPASTPAAINFSNLKPQTVNRKLLKPFSTQNSRLKTQNSKLSYSRHSKSIFMIPFGNSCFAL
jgi:hypothetical protein